MVAGLDHLAGHLRPEPVPEHQPGLTGGGQQPGLFGVLVTDRVSLLQTFQQWLAGEMRINPDASLPSGARLLRVFMLLHQKLVEYLARYGSLCVRHKVLYPEHDHKHWLPDLLVRRLRPLVARDRTLATCRRGQQA